MTKQTEKLLRGIGWILGVIAILIAAYGILKTENILP